MQRNTRTGLYLKIMIWIVGLIVRSLLQFIVCYKKINAMSVRETSWCSWCGHIKNMLQKWYLKWGSQPVWMWSYSFSAIKHQASKRVKPKHLTLKLMRWKKSLKVPSIPRFHPYLAVTSPKWGFPASQPTIRRYLKRHNFRHSKGEEFIHPKKNSKNPNGFVQIFERD